CALALGFEPMAPGPLGTNSFLDRLMGPLLGVAGRSSSDSKRGLQMPRIFGAAAAEYLGKCGRGMEGDRRVLCSRRKAISTLNNLYSQFWAGYDEAAVLASPQISSELAKYIYSPTS
ncbi:hypothetical protein EDB87DRAFT_1546713, partial [Lactarius vividus]